MKIQSITTKHDVEIPLGKFTVLVGPNNVGKSQTLKDIHLKMFEGPSGRTIIVKNIAFEKPPTFEDLIDGLEVRKDPKHIGYHLIRGISSNLTSGEEFRLELENLQKQFAHSDRLDFTFGNISKFKVAYLDAGSRLLVARTGPAHNPHTNPPQNLLQGLFAVQDETEERLRQAFTKTFNMDVCLDYSGMTQLTLRVANKFDTIPEDPRKAYPVISKYQKLDDQGDGFRSFVGVVLSLLLSKGRVVLLDEPEAFLHPAQARQLGYWIAEHASTVPGQIIVATHNANFLAGILSSTQPADIFRLNRTEDKTDFTRISADATSKLAKSPLLSSQRVLEAIFFRGVVVCEADADRAVYHTVAIRELENQDILFIHAHNKQSIPQVVSLLKNAQIPVSAITDLDALNSETDLRQLLESLGPQHEIERILELRTKIAVAVSTSDDQSILKELRARIEEFLEQLKQDKHSLSGARGALNRLRKEATDWREVKANGIKGLPSSVEQDAEELLTLAKKNGLFLVPVGELECWMGLGTSKKNNWIVLALEELHNGGCPTELKEFVNTILNFLGAIPPNETPQPT